MNPPLPRRLRVEHLSRFRYAAPARGGVMLLRLRPREEGGQRLCAFTLDIEPAAVPVAFADSFGNPCHLFNVHRTHRETLVRSRLTVETVEPAPPAAGGADDADTDAGGWEALARTADRVRFWDYLVPSRFARPGPALDAFVAAHGIRRGAGPFATLVETASALHRAIRYESGSTRVDSPIEHVLETGRGVCQDYAHVMIAIARSWGIPSRYVSGYLHTESVAGAEAQAGASHAWAEFLLPGRGWTGIDPTNDMLADARHVRVAVGRDYADAAPTRGAVFGGGESALEVRVSVADAAGPSPSGELPAGELRTERPDLRHVAPAPRARPARTDQQ